MERPLRRALKWLAWITAAAIGLPLVLIALALVAANTDPGRRSLERLTGQLTGGTVKIEALSGRFPDSLRIGRLQVADAAGVYVTIDNAVLDWSPTRLLHREALIDRLLADRVSLARLPKSSPSTGNSTTSTTLPVRVVLRQLQVARLDVGEPVAGTPLALAVDGAGTLETLTQGSVRLAVRQLDGQGRYAIDGTVDPARIQATIKVNEPPHGLIAGLAGLPGVGAITADATLDGPPSALGTRLAITAGALLATATGTIDLEHEAADLTVVADAPAMAPRPDIAWRAVHLDTRMHGPFTSPDAAGSVRIEALQVAGAAIGALNADLSGNAGQVHLHAQFDGLRVPGPQPDLLAQGPLVLDASARLDAPDRPVTFRLSHTLLSAEGTAQTMGALRVRVALTLPDLAPLAAVGGIVVQGHSVLDIDAAQDNGAISVAVLGTVGITGGMAPVPAVIGDAAHIDLAARMQGEDVTLNRLQVDGKALSVEASGALIGGRAALAWRVGLADLTAFQPTLSGQASLNGHVDGPIDDLAVTADLTGDVAGNGYHSGTLTAHVDASGLPGAPTAQLTAQGTLLDAPLSVALAIGRHGDATDVSIDHADWKSLHANGAVHLVAPASLPTGRLDVTMTRLADLAPLLGQPIAGSATASLDADAQAARLGVTVQGVALPGTAAITRGTVNATVADPTGTPSIDGTATLDGLAVSGTTASVRLTGRGPTDALMVNAVATAPDLQGAPARVETAGMVNATARTFDLTTLRAEWKQLALRLTAPAKIAFGDSVAVDRLRLALGQAALEAAGKVSPSLDLTASLRNLPVGMAADFAPAFAADGTVTADARLNGSTSRPTGTVRVTATGVKLRQGVAQALPAANLTAAATLDGSAARLDVRLAAGPSNLTVTGLAPMAAGGTLALQTRGLLDLVMLDPILAADGRRVRGRLTLDAAIAGTTAAPRVTGTAQLANGDVQDITLGAHVSDLAALVEAAGDTIRLTRFSGKAGPGTIGVSGSVGLAGAMPVDLRLTADNARPLSSDLITALVDANLTLQGELKGNMAAGGRLHVRRADIRVPERMPQSIAVLPIHQAGAPPPPPPALSSPTEIALNLTLDAPQQVFIRGRGLDVELGGTIHIGGTSTQPQPDGGLQLRRGTLSVVGQTLNFTEGGITFTGAGLADPAVHLVATTTTSTMVATLTVSGSAKDPKITLSSVPDQPQDEILAQMLFNSTSSKLSPFQMAEIAAALASLSGAPSGVTDPLASLRSTFGLDRLTVGSSKSGSPTLEAGSYLARGVYLGAKQSATGGGTQASLQIDLAKGLKLETTAGTGSSSATGSTGSADAASVGLTYQFEY